MDAVPPLNLTTCIKVENSLASSENGVKNGEEAVDSRILHHTEGNENYVILQNASNDENQVLTITGEIVEDVSTVSCSPEGAAAISNLVEDIKEEGDKLYNCPQCEKTFSRASLLRSHEKNHVQDKILSCELCSKTFRRLSMLIVHRQEHCKNPIQCPNCDISINSYAAYRIHMKKHRGDKKFKCAACPMRFVQNSHLKIHMRKHTGEKPYTCDICKTGFKQMSHLTTHLRTHTNDKPYACDICDAAFSQTGSLRRHKRSHTGEKPFKCEMCQALFVEKRNLTRHMLSHSGIRPYKCDQCDGSFTQFIDLKRHKYSHLGIKPFKCDLCEAAFSRKSNLKWHKLTHEGDSPHRCEICNVGFRIPRDLKNHLRLHNDHKPFSCELCNASFSQVANLKRHLTLHSGNRPHTCEKCSASFFEKSALKRHLLRHEMGKKYNCDLCNATFFEIRALKRHKTSLHSVQNDATSKNFISKTGSLENKSEALYSANLECHLTTEGDQVTTFDPAYQQIHNPSIPFSDKMSLQQARPTEVSTQTFSNVINEITQHNSEHGPTLVLSTPGQPVKTGRPAMDCQNHQSHIHTIVDGEYGQWQTWCFCETPNIPNSDSARTQLPNSEAQMADLSSSLGPPSTYSTLSFGTPVISQARGNGSIPPQDSLQSLRENVSIRPHEIVNNHFQEKNKPSSIQSNLSSIYHDLPPESQENYSQISHFRNFESVQHFDTPSSAESNTTLPRDEMQLNMNPHLQSTKASYSSIETISFTESISEKKPLQSKVSKNKSIAKEAENDLTVTHILPHSLDISSYSQASQISASEQQLPRISHITSLAPHHNCQETVPEDLHFQNNQEIAFSHIEYPGHQINQEEQILQPKDLNDEVQMDSAYEAINPKQFIEEATLSSQIHGEYPPISTSDIPPNLSDPKDHIQVQYSLTVNNPTTGDIEIQSDSFPAKAAASPAKAPPKKRKVQRSTIKEECQIKCDKCSKTFHKQSQYELHIRLHNGEKPYICGVCSQAFAHNNSLSVHMRCHTGEKPYKCFYCPASFSQKSNLRVHHRTHTGEKPFKCHICGATFAQGSHLTAHIRIHNNERPYACPTCGHAFTQKSALKRHEMKHAAAKSHKCEACNTVFNLREELQEHSIMHTDNKQTIAKLAKTANIKKEEITPENKNSEGQKEEVSNEEENSLKERSPERCIEDIPKSPLSLTADVVENATGNSSFEEEKDQVTLEVNKGEEEAVQQQQQQPEVVHQDEAELKEPDGKVTSGCKTPKRAKLQGPTRSSKRIKEAAGKKKFKEFSSDFITDLNEIDAVEQLEEEAIQASRKSRKREVKVESDGVQSWCFCEIPHGPDEPHTRSANPPLPSSSRDGLSLKAENLTKDTNLPYCGSSNENVLQLSLSPISQALVLHGEQQASNPQRNASEVNRGGSHIPLSQNSVIFNATEIPNGPEALTPNLSMVDSNQVSLNAQLITGNENVVSETNVITNQALENEDERTLYNAAQIISSQVLPTGQYITQDGTVFIEAAEINLNSGAVLLNSSSGALYLDLTSDGQLINVPIGSGSLQEPVIVTDGSSGCTEGKYPYAANATADGIEMVSDPLGFTNNTSQSNTIIEVPRNVTHLRTNSALQDTSVANSASSIAFQEAHSTTMNNCPEFLQSTDSNKVSEGIVLPTPEAPKSTSNAIIVNPPKCSVCSKVYAQKQTLKNHMDSEHPGLVYCPICFDAFTSKEHLQAHKAKHKSSYVCYDCCASFSSKRTFNKHRQKMHHAPGSQPAKNEERPFLCKQCDAKFMQYSDLKRHILSHSGIKPYKCNHCAICFTRKSSLNKHERIHTGEKPYKCKKCEQAFAYRYQFNRHKGCWST